MFKRSFLIAVVLAAASPAFQAQQPATAPTPSVPAATAPAEQEATSRPIDPKAHEAAVKLAKVADMRQKMLNSLDSIVQQGKDSMVSKVPGIDPRFVEEWGNRMRAKTNVDDFVTVIVDVYARHFTESELNELIQAQLDAKQSKPAALSPALTEKLGKEGVAVQSEILGACTQLGAKLGGEVGQEIAKEHPDWVKSMETAPKPPTP